MLKIFISFLLLLLVSQAHAENTAKELLDDFFSGLKTLSANFEQTVQNSQLNATESAKGKLWIQRPGKFRWNYETPYVQEIVSDGQKIWIYDADLEQVTVKKVDKTLGSTPALLLSHEISLDENFIIQPLSKGLALNWVILLPKDHDAGFMRIQLGFNQTRLEEMQLEDNLGQITRMVFSELKRNPTFSSSLFQFMPPPNTDIFDNSQ